MPFSAPFREPNLAPIFTPGGAVVIPWYLLGGVTAAQCVAAYQPKGAADLAASYINLNNPGTNNAAPGTAPTFATATGWTGGSNAYLTTGIIPASRYWSIIVRYTGGGTGFAIAEHNQSADSARYGLSPNTSADYNWGGGGVNGAAGASGIIALASSAGYYNGIYDATVTAAWVDGACIQFFILCRNLNGNPNAYFTGAIQAVAIYNITLSSTQVGLISTAMAAL